MNLDKQIAQFLGGQPHAVVGASTDRAKFGNKALRSYMQAGRRVFPVNPHEGEIEGLRAFTSLELLPEPVHGISIVTPPAVTERIVESAIALGIQNIWMQPGAESRAAVKLALGHGCNVIHGGPCILVVLGFREHG